MEPKDLAIKIAKHLYKKNAHDIDVIDVSHRTIITDYLVIASGQSFTQVRALMEEVEQYLAKDNINCTRKEGAQEARWGVIDYETVMVHIFHKQDRDFYKLDSLWADDNNVLNIEYGQEE